MTNSPSQQVRDQSPSGASGAPPFPFFRLPAELRLAIYEQVAIDHDTDQQPVFFNSCREIRAEALTVFYQHHSFYFKKTPEAIPNAVPFGSFWNPPKVTVVSQADANMAGFLQAIGCENAALIRHLIIEVPGT